MITEPTASEHPGLWLTAMGRNCFSICTFFNAKKANHTVYEWRMIQLQHWIAENAASEIAMAMRSCYPWIFRTRKLWWFGFSLFAVDERHIQQQLWTHLTAKVPQEVNRKCHPRNTTVQLSTPYTKPECHNAQSHRQMERWTDDSMMPIADTAV